MKQPHKNACFTTMLTSSANSVNSSHSSLDMLDDTDTKSLGRPFKIYFTSWLKKSFKPGWPGGGFQLDLGWNTGLSKKSSEGWSLKLQLICILLEKSSNSFHSLGSKLVQNLTLYPKLEFLSLNIGKCSNIKSKR